MVIQAPEPSRWLLLGVGLGCLGAAAEDESAGVKGACNSVK